MWCPEAEWHKAEGNLSEWEPVLEQRGRARLAPKPGKAEARNEISQGTELGNRTSGDLIYITSPGAILRLLGYVYNGPLIFPLVVHRIDEHPCRRFVTAHQPELQSNMLMLMEMDSRTGEGDLH
jgi:hypothetical protein